MPKEKKGRDGLGEKPGKDSDSSSKKVGGGPRATNPSANLAVKKRKSFLLIFLLAVAIVIFFFSFILGTKTYFTLNDELKLSLSPVDASLQSIEKSPVKVDFRIDTENYRFCTANCSYYLYDMSRGIMIDKGNFSIRSDGGMNLSYMLGVDEKGTGQRVYSFQVSCRNIKAALCRSYEEDIVKSSFLTLNYGLNRGEYSAMDYSNRTLLAMFSSIRGADGQIRSNSAYLDELISAFSHTGDSGAEDGEPPDKERDVYEYSALAPPEFLALANDNAELAKQLKNEMDNSDEFAIMWEDEEYVLLESALKSHGSNWSKEILLSAIGIKEAADLLRDKHSQTVMLFDEITAKEGLISDIHFFYSKVGDEDRIDEAKDLVFRINFIAKKLNENSFQSYSELYGELVSINSSISLLESHYEKERAGVFMAVQYPVLKNEIILEKIKASLLSDAAFAPANITSQIPDFSGNSSMPMSGIYKSLSEEYPSLFTDAAPSALLNLAGTDDVLAINCRAASLSGYYMSESNLRAQSFRETNYPWLASDPALSKIIDKFSENVDSDSDNTLYEMYKGIDISNNSREYNNYLALMDAAPGKKKKIYSINYINYTYSNISVRDYMQMSLFNMSFSLRYCDNTSVPPLPKLKLYMGVSILGIEFSEKEPVYNATIDKNSKKCCLNSVCKDCCSYGECNSDSTLYPVIFLHGHAFSKRNTPDYSLLAFSDIQRKLISDGFIDGGQITAGTSLADIPDGEWGIQSFPVTFRASYYYITYFDLGIYSLVTEKNEGIENYAIRLKEIIDIVKRKTGRDKVKIVAHSMGGLVAREYVSLFGEDNVDKIIMIGTPNNGTIGRINSLCGVFGSKKECEDLSQGSIFLKKLNSAQNAPEKTKLYTIYGVGCDMDGVDGDGIAAAESVKLPFAENHMISGACTDSLNMELHSNLLSPELYPRSYEIIASILKI